MKSHYYILAYYGRILGQTTQLNIVEVASEFRNFTFF